MSIDDIITLALHHYVVCGLGALAFGIVLNLAVQCGPELIQAIRPPRLQ